MIGCLHHRGYSSDNTTTPHGRISLPQIVEVEERGPAARQALRWMLRLASVLHGQLRTPSLRVQAPPVRLAAGHSRAGWPELGRDVESHPRGRVRRPWGAERRTIPALAMPRAMAARSGLSFRSRPSFASVITGFRRTIFSRTRFSPFSDCQSLNGEMRSSSAGSFPGVEHSWIRLPRKV